MSKYKVGQTVWGWSDYRERIIVATVDRVISPGMYGVSIHGTGGIDPDNSELYWEPDRIITRESFIFASGAEFVSAVQAEVERLKAQEAAR